VCCRGKFACHVDDDAGDPARIFNAQNAEDEQRSERKSAMHTVGRMHAVKKHAPVPQQPCIDEEGTAAQRRHQGDVPVSPLPK